jgi:hypothetical protein
MNVNLLAIGTVSSGFVTNLHVPICWSWVSSLWIAFSHLGQSKDFLASFNVVSLSPAMMAYISSFDGRRVSFDSSSSSGKGF